MKLRGLSLSPYYERVLIVLERQNALDRVELLPPVAALGTPDAKAENPSGKIPYLLLDDGSMLTEGQLIAEYFNDSLGAGLIPAEPLAAARTRLFGRLVDIYLGQFTTPLARTFTRGTRDEPAIATALATGIPGALDQIEFHLTGGDYAVGDRFTLADASLIPFMFHLTVFLKDFDLKPFDGRPKFEAWWQAQQDTALVERCFARMQKSLDFILSLRKQAQ